MRGGYTEFIATHHGINNEDLFCKMYKLLDNFLTIWIIYNCFWRIFGVLGSFEIHFG